jgi:hypothetical protein
MVVPPSQALAGLEGLLHGPAAVSDADHVAQRHRLRGVAAVEGQLTCVAVATDQQRPTLRIRQVRGVAVSGVAPRGVRVFDPGPVLVALALRARPGREPLPGPAAQASGNS